MPEGTQKSASNELHQLRAYHQAVADAGLTLAGAQRAVCTEWQRSVAAAHGAFATADSQSGWDRWAPVHEVAAALREAVATREDERQGYLKYCDALETFRRTRHDDRVDLCASLAERLRTADEKARDGYREGHSAYLSALGQAAKPAEVEDGPGAGGGRRQKAAKS